MTIIITNDMMVIVHFYLLILIPFNLFLQVEVSVALSPVHNPAHILGSPAIPNPGIPTIPTIPNHGIPTIPSPPKTHPPSHPTHTVAPSCSDSLLVEVVTTFTHLQPINITHQVHVSTTNNCLLRRPPTISHHLSHQDHLPYPRFHHHHHHRIINIHKGEQNNLPRCRPSTPPAWPASTR